MERVVKDSDRDYWMSAAEAKEYGLIDEVVTAHKKAQPEEAAEKSE
jgi:ATP-dependent Clp protease protease subunit